MDGLLAESAVERGGPGWDEVEDADLLMAGGGGGGAICGCSVVSHADCHGAWTQALASSMTCQAMSWVPDGQVQRQFHRRECQKSHIRLRVHMHRHVPSRSEKDW